MSCCYRSLGNFKHRAEVIENKVEGMRAGISTQEETLEVLTTVIGRLEQTIVSATDNLTNAIVSTGEI